MPRELGDGVVQDSGLKDRGVRVEALVHREDPVVVLGSVLFEDKSPAHASP